jgi:hypothetical protein
MPDRLRWLAGVLAIGLGLVSIGQAQAAAAIAVGVSDNPADGIAYGWAINFKTVDEARKEAMENCRAYKPAPNAARFCRLIGAADKQCVALAFDPKDDSSGMGWALAADREQARKRALDDCRAAAPAGRKDFCEVDILKCDGE